jgi:hypothetical protein
MLQLFLHVLLAACYIQDAFGQGNFLSKKGASAKSVDDEEPLLKPSETVFAWQISGLVSEYKVPLQLILTSKSASSSQLPSGVRTNIIGTLSMDPQMRLRWLDDKTCLEYLQQHFKPAYVNMLKTERRGSFRGDICRAAVLYREGGFYTDLDLELRVPFTSVIDKKTTFMSTFTADNAILNALIAAEPRNAVMRETLKELRKWYGNEVPHVADQADGSTSEWMGPLTMLRGLKAVMKAECQGKDPKLMQSSRLECGKENLMLYREAELNCFQPSDECPPSRMRSDFYGVKFGIFENTMARDRKLIAWPRYADCTDWGCQSGGWHESDLQDDSGPDAKGPGGGGREM